MTRKKTRTANSFRQEGQDGNFPKKGGERTSIFHPQNLIAFAPSTDGLESDIDAIFNLPSPSALRRGTDPNEVIKARYHQASTRHSNDKPIRLKVQKQGKVPLPRPYKHHWAEIERRRASRDFIYGRDEEYEFMERDIRVKTPCNGVLCFHALELLDLVVNKQSFTEDVPISYYCLLIIGSTKRCSKIVHAFDPRQIKMDTFIHLSIDISEWREAPNNKLRIELWSFQNPEAHFIVGTVEIHIYNFIRLQHLIETVNLWSDGLNVGKLAYEVAFSYGAFGYGHSNQLKNFSQPMMETISHSMFPRIKLDDKVDIADVTFQARLPDQLKLFTYHSLILEVDDKHPNISKLFNARKSQTSNRFNRIDLEPKPMIVQQVEFKEGFPVHCKVHMNIWQQVLQPDFNDMYGEYVCIGHKRERLDYLTNLVQGRMRDLFEQETLLFHYLNQDELDEINRSENNPNEVLFPKTIPCPHSEPFTIDNEDEAFQDKFPSVRRRTGYLSQLFGYNKDAGSVEDNAGGENVAGTGTDMRFLKSHHEATVQKSTKKNKKHNKWIDSMKNLGFKIRMWFIAMFNYIFPEVRDELEVPEISLTLASPEGSTSNVYAYFAREAKEREGSSKVDRLVKQTTALIDMTRKTQMARLNDSDTTSSSSGEEGDG